MVKFSYQEATQTFQTPLDFIRFGVSHAAANGLYYGHGTDNVRDDIWALILGCLQLPSDIDPILLHGQLTTTEKTRLCDALGQRIEKRIPVPYITHEAHFAGLSFYVDDRVLIPRSPIAELIRQQFSPWIDASNVQQVLDLCTGSACIAIACCYAFPDAMIDAADISADALKVAETNSQRHGVESMLTLFESDCFSHIPATQYDIIVSNPPYVSADEMQTLPQEYRHEPVLALEAPQKGLAIVERILRQAAAYLSDQGILVVEVGNSEDALVEAYPHVPFTWLDFECGGEGIFLLTQQQLIDFFPATGAI